MTLLKNSISIDFFKFVLDVKCFLGKRDFKTQVKVKNI